MDAAIESLYATEKAARLAEDTACTKAAAGALVDVLAAAGRWAALGEAVTTLAKRRGQMKGVIQEVVRKAAVLADAAPDAAAREALVHVLLSVTEGKIYVEIDRARLTRRLAAAKEAAGDADGAAALLQEVAVETFGAMAKTEKIDYILEQVRLCLDRGDYVRCEEERGGNEGRARQPPSPHPAGREARLAARSAADAAGAAWRGADEATAGEEESARGKRARGGRGELCAHHHHHHPTLPLHPPPTTPPFSAHILSKKVAPRAFIDGGKKGQTAGDVGIEGTVIEAPIPGTPAIDALKLKHYDLMVRYWQFKEEDVEVTRCLRAAYDTPCVLADAAAADALLKRTCWYAVLAPKSSSDAATLLASTALEPRLDGLPLYRKLLALFRGRDIVRWPDFEAEYGPEVAAVADVFGGTGGAARLERLRVRVTQHNVHAAASYYERLTLARLAALLGLGEGASERAVAGLVSSGALAAKIDRPARIVSFAPTRTPDDVLNGWAGGISRLLTVLDRAGAAIAKEAAVHRVDLAAAGLVGGGSSA